MVTRRGAENALWLVIGFSAAMIVGDFLDWGDIDTEWETLFAAAGAILAAYLTVSEMRESNRSSSLRDARASISRLRDKQQVIASAITVLENASHLLNPFEFPLLGESIELELRMAEVQNVLDETVRLRDVLHDPFVRPCEALGVPAVASALFNIRESVRATGETAKFLIESWDRAKDDELAAKMLNVFARAIEYNAPRMLKRWQGLIRELSVLQDVVAVQIKEIEDHHSIPSALM